MEMAKGKIRPAHYAKARVLESNYGGINNSTLGYLRALRFLFPFMLPDLETDGKY